MPGLDKTGRPLRSFGVAAAAALLAGGLWALWSQSRSFWPDQSAAASSPRILVLDNADSNYEDPPFNDVLLAADAAGRVIRSSSSLNISEASGGRRALSVREDGRTYTVVENTGRGITTYDTATGERLWRHQGRYVSVVTAPSGRTYALTTRFARNDTTVFDEQGKVLRTAPVKGFDLVLDPRRDTLWVVLQTIKKCDLDLNVLAELDLGGGNLSSADVSADGSLWVAERDHPDISKSRNRIFRISPDMEIVDSIDLPWEPFCIRVDPGSGAIWVTGIQYVRTLSNKAFDAADEKFGPIGQGTEMRSALIQSARHGRTLKYDRDGELLNAIDEGGYSLSIDPSDASVWIAGTGSRIHHYSAEGDELGGIDDVSDGQKFIAVVPPGSTK